VAQIRAIDPLLSDLRHVIWVVQRSPRTFRLLFHCRSST
jgi:hypothetical protein